MYADRVGGNRLNQRFHRLFPSNESYIAEMESALFNTVLAQQAKAGEGIRYFTQLTYQKEIPTNGGKCAWAGKGCESSHLGTGPTCCEGQGSRLFASIPEYIFSLSHDGIRVDLFSSASINFTSPAGAAWTLNMETAWPHGEAVQLQLERPASPAGLALHAAETFAVHVRIPGWVATDAVQLKLNGGSTTFKGEPGTTASMQRAWKSGDILSFSLPMRLRSHRYPSTGLSQLRDPATGQVLPRFAVTYGPLLLAATVDDYAKYNASGAVELRINASAEAPHTWLVPEPVPDFAAGGGGYNGLGYGYQPRNSLRWKVKGVPGVVYAPYFELDEEYFDVYPIVVGRTPTIADPDGARAAALRRAVDSAKPNDKIKIEGTYNLSRQSLAIVNKVNLTLEAAGGSQAPALFLFAYNDDVHSDEAAGPIHAGINITDSIRVTIRGATIDYQPKSRTLFCPNPRAVNTSCPAPSGPGITLHMFNSADTLVEDLVIHAAPYMAITSFNGEGGHVLRRVSFVPNEPGQVWVAERDGVHESDVRRGITLEDSVVGYLNDDFVNVHSTLLVVLRCSGSSCLLINPHVEGGAVLDTTYAMNSLLEGARPGDTMSFFPLLKQSTPKPAHLSAMFSPPAAIKGVSKVTDPKLIEEATKFASSLTNDTANNVMGFAGPQSNCFGQAHCWHVVDLWRVDFASPLPSAVPSASLVSVNELGSAGARFVGNTFTNTTCGARWKSSNSLVANNTFAHAGLSCWPNCDHELFRFELTYLQPWLEGPALISNVTFESNTFYFGEGRNPILPAPIDTSGIVERNNRFLPQQPPPQGPNHAQSTTPLLNISLVPSCANASLVPSAICPDKHWPWPHGGPAPPAVNGHVVSLGDIRAVVQAHQAGPVSAQIWWRRRDPNPEVKAVIVTDESDSRWVPANAVVEPDCGVVSFNAPSPGVYHVYYLPYVETGDWANTLFHWFNCTNTQATVANPCVIDTTRAGRVQPLQATAGAASGCARVVPPSGATVLRLETRSSPQPLQEQEDFPAFHSMEMIATSQELSALLQSHSGAPFMAFMTPREDAVRMFDQVPASWGRSGEVHALVADAMCGEYFTFQVGLWAALADVDHVSLSFNELLSTAGGPVVPASAFRCFNLAGTDQHGVAFRKNFTVTKGAVGSLWVGVELPADASAAGTYRSNLTLTASGVSIALDLTLNVGLAPTKALCSTNCTLVEVEPAGSGFVGSFDQAAHGDITSLQGCKAACLASPDCVQSTFQPRPVDPCVLYTAISTKKDFWAPNVVGFVKCEAGATNATACATFAGPVADGGRADIYKLGRLSWLDSTLGIDEEVSEGFAPVHVTHDGGMSVHVGGCNKSVLVGSSGLIRQALVDHTKVRRGQPQTSQRAVLASPFRFVLLDAARKPIPISVDSPAALTKSTPATAAWKAQLRATDGLRIDVKGSLDYDSYGEYNITLTATSSAVRLSDVRLELDLSQDVARYMVGMGHASGTTLDSTSWRWKNTSGDPFVWVGRVEAGLFVKLRGAGSDWESPMFGKAFPVIPFVPPSWGGPAQRGVGAGCNISAGGEIVAYSGPRTLRPGQSVSYQFDYALTPSKVLNLSAHFEHRYHQVTEYQPPEVIKGMGANVANLHQGITGSVFLNGSNGPNLVNPYIVRP